LYQPISQRGRDEGQVVLRVLPDESGHEGAVRYHSQPPRPRVIQRCASDLAGEASPAAGRVDLSVDERDPVRFQSIRKEAGELSVLSDLVPRRIRVIANLDAQSRALALNKRLRPYHLVGHR
jgi:hypothetical protein